MAKRLRLHLRRFLNSCRSSSSSSTATFSTIPSPKQPNPPTSPSSDHHHFLHNTPHSSSTTSSASSSSSTSFLHNPVWHVPSIPSPRCKIDSSDDTDHLFPPLSLPKPSYRKTMQHLRSTTNVTQHKKNKTNNKTKKKKKKKKRRDRTNPTRTSSSSSSPDDTVWFSSDGGETDTLIAGNGGGGSRKTRSNVLLNKMMVTCTEEKVKGSFAVVKRSEDPYGDFKRSMVEMVTGRHLYEKSELRELLRCFLSLNSAAHHDAILRAFYEVCHAMFLSVDLTVVSQS